MNKDNLMEFNNITDELNRLLIKFEELNSQYDKIKNNISDYKSEEVEILLGKIEFKYSVLDKKMRELKKRSSVLNKNKKN